MNKSLLSSKNMCWCTPQKFFDELNAEFNFVLDAAATKKSAKEVGIAAARYSAIPLMVVKSGNGLKKHIENP